VLIMTTAKAAVSVLNSVLPRPWRWSVKTGVISMS